MSDPELVKLCLAEICKKSGYDHSQRLTQRELEFLCDEIASKTGILISLSTFKRLLNGQFTRLPQVATLNAITVYLGYENWQDFKIKKKKEEPVSPSLQADPPASHSTTKSQSRIPYKVIGLSIAVLAVIVIIASKKIVSAGPANYDSVLFTVKKTTAGNIPNTVVFNYNIDELEGDSFFIQQSWDEHRRVRVYKNNYTLTDIYYEPGYHNAKLMVNDRVIKTIGVSIPTDRWFFYAKESAPGSLPNYIKTNNAVNNGMLSLVKDDIVNNRIDFSKDQQYIYTYFPSKHTVESDNFTLTAKIRMTDLRNLTCPKIMVEVFCQNNFMYFHTTPPGCSGDIHAQFGENRLHGKITDLSGFSCDVLQWHQVDMIVKNRQVTIYINRQQVYTNNYKESSGLVTGLGFISNGLCAIDSVALKGLDGAVVYESDFAK